MKNDNEIIAYAKRDKRSKSGILLSNGKPAWIVSPKNIDSCIIDDFIPLTRYVIKLRGEVDWFRSMGFEV
jgi:hypothetical protein